MVLPEAVKVLAVLMNNTGAGCAFVRRLGHLWGSEVPLSFEIEQRAVDGANWPIRLQIVLHGDAISSEFNSVLKVSS